ncbi:MAG: DNA polymerase II [Pseudomonadota bacterium]
MPHNGKVIYRGFIYQATYRISGAHPVGHYFGLLENGERFLIRDHRSQPTFYVRACDRSAALRLGAQAGKTTGAPVRSLVGEPLTPLVTAVPGDVPAIRERLHDAGLPTFEADLRFAYRRLIDAGVRCGVAIDGEPRPGRTDAGVDWLFDDPQLQPASVAVAPRVLALDIETDPTRDALLAISLYGCDEAIVLLCDPDRRPVPEGVRSFPDERSLLAHFVQRVRRADPDVLTGWNVIDFDLAQLLRFAERAKLILALGRDEQSPRLRQAEGYFGSSAVSLAGRLVLDGVDLLRGAFVSMESYALDAVARQVLGEGKVLKGDAKNRLGEILQGYRNDLPAFCAYSLADSRLVIDILSRLKLVELALARGQLTGMTPDRVAASIASFDYLYMIELHRRGIAAPTLKRPSRADRVPQAGGRVFEPRVGHYHDVWVFDFKSLYPSIIRTFNIDPLGFRGTADESPLPSGQIEVGGARFDRAPGILPALLDDLFPQRSAAKAAGNSVAAQAIKILMNSFYGVLGTSACRFYNPRIANAITAEGRRLLNWARDWFTQRGYAVLYGDTDSLFVLADRADPSAAAGRALAVQLNEDLSRVLSTEARVSSRLELEFEKRYEQLVLPALRGGTGGARKRYVGLREGDLEFVGMEVVRRDWTALARHTQRALYERLFRGEDVAGYLADRVRALRAGELDDELIYRKGLRKPVAEYTANTPPHVQAARKSASPAGGRRQVIAYRMTRAGPEPVDAQSAPVDLEHYVEKQLRPVAEPVLDLLGLNFAQVVGDDRQLGLF